MRVADPYLPLSPPSPPILPYLPLSPPISSGAPQQEGSAALPASKLLSVIAAGEACEVEPELQYPTGPVPKPN